MDYIKNKLDEYLEFDSSLLFFDEMVRIFGGSIRDIICNDNINDIDILCGSKSYRILSSLLKSQGYIHFDTLRKGEIMSIYSDIKVINEPSTWLKNNKIIQLIRPCVNSAENESLYKDGFINLIQNVDLSCCGLSYDGNLYENYPDSILHCQTKKYEVNSSALMYSQKRFIHREAKLINRGWEKISNKRDFRIDVSLDKKSYISLPYITETEYRESLNIFK